MNSLIVEKILIDRTGSTEYYAVATSEPNSYSVLYSLTFEGHLTPWNSNRREVEALQRLIGHVQGQNTPHNP